MPTTVKHDVGTLRRIVKHDLGEVRLMYMAASPWFGGPSGLVFQKINPISSTVLTMRESQDLIFRLWINFRTGDISWAYDEDGDKRDEVLVVNGISYAGSSVEARPGQWVYYPHPVNYAKRIAAVAGLAIPNIGQYRDMSMSTNLTEGRNPIVIEQHPAPGNDYVGILSIGDGQGSSAFYTFSVTFNGS